MTDEPIKLPEGMAPTRPGGVQEHRCEHPGCTEWGGWGFSKPKQESHWFCYEHKADGERCL